MGVPAPRFHGQGGNEESWTGDTRIEVKSGRQCARTASLFLEAEAQSEASRAIGDVRPFVMVMMPDGWGSEGLVIFRMSNWGQGDGVA